jgi:hypothetical protein
MSVHGIPTHTRVNHLAWPTANCHIIGFILILLSLHLHLPHNLYTYIVSLICATCPTHHFVSKSLSVEIDRYSSGTDCLHIADQKSSKEAISRQ